jgi:glyoxylase-like metal-dependent hydrolase (beta-lactamase superfamily II)
LRPPETLYTDPPDHSAAIEVAEGVLWLRFPLPMALDHVNCYALDEGDHWTVVDTGLNWKTGRAAWDAVLAGPLKGKPVGRVLVTHHHPDHVGLAGRFVDAGAELMMPRTAWLLTRMLTLDEQPSYSEAAVDFYRRAGMPEAMLTTRRSERPFNFADCVMPLPPGYRRIVEGERLRLGGRDWVVRMGDGHAPEHATLWSESCTLVIGGDQLLPSISPNLGVYPTEPEADPVTDWIAACSRLAVHAREDQIVLPGHKLPFMGLPMRLRQMEQNHHEALARLATYLATPRRGPECFSTLFKREIGPAEYGLALAETLAHLNHLQQAGKARRWLDADGAYRWQAVPC